MTKGADWLAANDHPKGGRPAEAREWVRPRGETWYRPAPPRAGGADPAPTDRAQHRLIAAGRVADSAVYSQHGRRIGRIAEIAIDDATGEVAFVLLAGIGGKMSWEARNAPDCGPPAPLMTGWTLGAAAIATSVDAAAGSRNTSTSP